MIIIKSRIITNPGSTSTGGSGLQSFTSGNLSPLFTTSLGGDPLVNPALTFAAVSQNANRVYAGPATGGAAAPTFRALVAADLPSDSTAYWKTSGVTALTGVLTQITSTALQDLEITGSGGAWGFAVYNTNGASGEVIMSADQSQIIGEIATSQLYVVDERASGSGIQYFADYSANFATRSLVDKGYVLGAKTFTGLQTFRDDFFILQDNSDLTKQANFELSSIAAGNTRTLTVPNANGTIAVSASGNIALNATTGNITFTGILGPASGGTGIANNAASTITISGAFGTTFIVSNTTTVTLPTTGTLATLDGAESLTNKKLGSLTSNGFVKTSGGDGTLSVDTTTYQASGLCWLLASGGTATGTNTFAMGTNPFIMTSSVTTGTGATAGHQLVVNSLTTGNGFDVSSSSATTGFIGKFTSTSLVVNHTLGTHALLGVASSGANSTASKTVVGFQAIVTNTGTTNTNVGAYFEATGATTNNIAIQAAGSIQTKGFTTSGTYNLSLSKWNETTTQSIGVIGNNLFINSSGTVAREDTSISRGGAIAFYTAYSGIAANTIGYSVFNSGSASLTHPWTMFQNGVMQLIAGGQYGWVTSTTDSRGSIASLISHSSGTIQIVPTVGVFIGSAGTATARLHIAAGTATANTAPLKFNTGTNNTTAEAGAMEYNNTFHLTNSDATRRHVVLAPNTTKVTAGAPYANSGYIVMNVGGSDFNVMVTG